MVKSKKEKRRKKSASPTRQQLIKNQNNIRKRKNVKKRRNMKELEDEEELDLITKKMLAEYSDDNDDSSSAVSSSSSSLSGYEDIDDEDDIVKLRKLERKRQRIEEQEEDFWFLFIFFAIFLIGAIMIFYYVFNGGVSDGSGGGGGGGRRRGYNQQHQHHNQQVKDSVYHLSVTMKELYNGIPNKKVSIERQVICASCNNCRDCKNHRMQKETQRDFFSGRLYHTCYCEYHVSLPVNVKKGMKHLDLIRLDGEGNRHPNAYNGDVVFELRSGNSYGSFERFDQIHLKTKITISLKEALLGFRREIKHIDSHIVVVQREGKLTEHNDIIVIKNEGMPIKDEAQGMMYGSSTHGDLHVTVLVRFPSKISKKILKEFDTLF